MSEWSFIWDVLDGTGSVIGNVRSAGGEMVWDGGASIQRVVRGALFDSSGWQDVNPFRDRLRLMWVDNVGNSVPLGVFYVAQLPQRFTSTATVNPPEPYLVDSGLVLSQPSAIGFAGRLSESLSTAMNRLCDNAGITDRLVTVSSDLLGEPVLAPPGQTHQSTLAGLCELAGFLPPHFDRNGTLRLVPIPPLTAEPVAVYGPESIVRSSRVQDSNLLDAPNVFVVLGSGASASGISVEVEIPASAPHSVQNRGGRRVVAVVTEQGISSQVQAQRIAEGLAVRSALDYQTVNFDTVPNPLHDCYNILEVNGVRYRETSWGLPLSHEGQTMNHVVDRAEMTVGDKL